MFISPACAFISGGQSFIEICTLDGIKKIAIDGEQSQKSNKEHRSSENCDFCLSFAGFAGIAVPVQSVSDYMSAPDKEQPSTEFLRADDHRGLKQARAPPASLS